MTRHDVSLVVSEPDAIHIEVIGDVEDEEQVFGWVDVEEREGYLLIRVKRLHSDLVVHADLPTGTVLRG